MPGDTKLHYATQIVTRRYLLYDTVANRLQYGKHGRQILLVPVGGIVVAGRVHYDLAGFALLAASFGCLSLVYWFTSCEWSSRTVASTSPTRNNGCSIAYRHSRPILGSIRPTPYFPQTSEKQRRKAGGVPPAAPPHRQAASRARAAFSYVILYYIHYMSSLFVLLFDRSVAYHNMVWYVSHNFVSTSSYAK